MKIMGKWGYTLEGPKKKLQEKKITAAEGIFDS